MNYASRSPAWRSTPLGSGPDADAAKLEIGDIESEIVAAERAIRRAALAGAERERREQAVEHEAEQARKAKALGAADKLAASAAKAAQRIDEIAAMLAAAVKEHRDLVGRAHVLRVEADAVSRTTRLPSPYDSAIRFAFGVADVNALEPPLGGGPLGPRPMIEKQDTNDKES